MLLPIIICAVVSMILGFVWHSPLMFGYAWGEACGMSREEMANCSKEEMKKRNKQMMPILGIQFVVSLIQAFVVAAGLSKFVATGNASENIAFVTTSFLAYSFPVISGYALWTNKTPKVALKMFGISFGYNIILLIIYALIISSFM